MYRYKILNKMIGSRLAVVIRGDTLEEAEKVATACIDGGITSLEVTFTVPKANQLLEILTSKYRNVIIGAGTVLDSETARIAILAGAKFIVSPTFDKDTAKLCNRYSIPYLPGCMTVNEMVQAMEYGASIVKLFPGQLYDPSFIRSVKGPLPHVQIMPTGGINLDNIQSWIQAGAELVGVGGEITGPSKIGDIQKVQSLASQFLNKIEGDNT